MKYLILALLLGTAGQQAHAQAAPVATEVVATPELQEPTADTPALSNKEAAKKARKAQRQRGAEVYKGGVANQSRVLTDAPNAENDEDPEEAEKRGSRKIKLPGKSKAAPTVRAAPGSVPQL